VQVGEQPREFRQQNSFGKQASFGPGGAKGGDQKKQPQKGGGKADKNQKQQWEVVDKNEGKKNKKGAKGGQEVKTNEYDKVVGATNITRGKHAKIRKMKEKYAD